VRSGETGAASVTAVVISGATRGIGFAPADRFQYSGQPDG
jgi:hypothetical protein